jgi:hypothetical protein
MGWLVNLRKMLDAVSFGLNVFAKYVELQGNGPQVEHRGSRTVPASRQLQNGKVNLSHVHARQGFPWRQ